MTSREIACNSCSETALTYEGSVDHLDGTKHICKSCAMIGVVHVDADEEGAYVRFYQLAAESLWNVDKDLVVEAYLLSQKLLSDAADEIYGLRNNTDILKGRK